MRKKIVAGNWKMNTVKGEGISLAEGILERLSGIPSDVTLMVAPPFTHIYNVYETLKGSSVHVGAQNCADHRSGAYTGEVSVDMLSAVGCDFVILGHSERREYYGENAESLNLKMNLVMEAGMDMIFCVGEKLSERESGMHLDTVKGQIESVLYNMKPEFLSRLVIAYEPVWAIGTGKTATSAEAQEMHAFIRNFMADKFGNAANDIPILYGGSCKPSNAAELFAQRDIDGGLIGGAALKAEDFMSIAKSF